MMWRKHRSSALLTLPILATLLVDSNVEARQISGGSGTIMTGSYKAIEQDLGEPKSLQQDGLSAQPYELRVAPRAGSYESRLIHLTAIAPSLASEVLSSIEHTQPNRTLRHVLLHGWPSNLSLMVSAGHQLGSLPPSGPLELKDGTTSQWLTLAAVFPIILILDYIIMNLMAEGWRSNLMVLTLWFFCAVAYNAVVFLTDGVDDGIQWSNGFILEGLLSLDNLFAYHLIVSSFKVPPLLQRKAIFFGILGAMLLRVVLFCFMAQVLYAVTWFRFIVGAVIIYSGVAALTSEDTEEPLDADSSWCVQAVRFALGDRMWNHFDTENGYIFVEKDGKWRASLLLVVIVFLEAVDVVFACDSVSAKLAVIPDQYICYSSSIFAMFALRGMFFLVSDLVETFYLLKYGMACILLAIGLQLIVSPWYECPSLVMLVFTITVFLICILGSTVSQVAKARHSSDLQSHSSDLQSAVVAPP